MARFRLGKEDYYEGSHPLWELFRCVYQMRHSPPILGGLFILLGYLVGVLQRMERPVSPELIAFHRKEQMQRLKAKVTGLFRAKQTEWTT
jgi:hypothetical protein